MKVLTHIAGSKVVVMVGQDCYIDARIDARCPDFSFIEVVRGGQVRHRTVLHDSLAPGYIVMLMHLIKLGAMP